MAFVLAEKCPYPNCKHEGSVITNNHCLKTHGMTKKEVISNFGRPSKNTINMYKARMNNNAKKYTLYEVNGVLTK